MLTDEQQAQLDAALISLEQISVEIQELEISCPELGNTRFAVVSDAQMILEAKQAERENLLRIIQELNGLKE